MASRSLGTLTIDLVAKTGGFERGMDRAARTADKRMKEIERRMKAAGVVMGTALAAGATAAANQLRIAIDNMDDMSKAAQRVSLPTEQFSALVYAGKLADVEVNTLVTSLGRLTKAQADAERSTSEQARTFDALGIATKDAEGNLRSSLDVLYDFADAFKRQEGSPEIVAAGIKIFGRSFQSLIPLIKDGSQGLRGAADEAAAFGQIISTETGRDAEAFNDNLSRMGMLVSGLANAVAAELLPDLRILTDEWVRSANEGDKLTSTAKDIADAIRAVVEWMRQGSQVGASFRETMSQVSVMAEAAKENISGIFSADEARIDQSRHDFFEAGKKAWDAAVHGVEEGQRSNPLPVIQFITPESLFEQDRAAAARMKAAAEEAARLRKLAFGDAPKSGGARRKSDEERAAERMKSAYESLMGSMHQRIELFGKEGEAARVRYEIEHGSLKGISDALAKQAIQRAEQLDHMEKMEKLQRAAAEAAEEETRRISEGLESGRELLDNLRFELELMKMTNAERATAIQLRGLEKEAVAEYGDAIAEANRKIEESLDQIELMDGMRNSFATFFTDVIDGTKSVGDAFKDMLTNISNMLTRMMVERWVESMFGQMGTGQTGSAGGWFGAIASIFAGGKAGGGWASPNRMYEVNERGFEMATVRGRDYLLTGNSPVEITPNHKIGGGGPVVGSMNFAFAAPASPKTQAQVAARTGYELRRAQRFGA